MKTLLFLGILINLFFTYGQSFDRKVIASAGKDASNGASLSMNAYYMAYTVGEPLIYGGSSSTNKLNNGFIQPFPNATINPNTPSGLILANGDILVYPNPFGNYLMVDGPEENEEEIKVQLIDQQGKLILDHQLLPKKHKLEIPEYCAPGVYFLNLYSLQGQFIQQNKLIKMNVEQNENIR
jgi:hypothetical protein